MNIFSSLCLCTLGLLLLFAFTSSQPAEEYSGIPSAYTQHTRYEPSDHTLFYGDEALLRTPHTSAGRQVPDATYQSFVSSMPIVCVDILLTRPDGRVLLVQRHAEPVKNIFWYPGGRLLMGETFSEAAVRKTRTEIGVHVRASAMLGTWNTFFEKSAWGGATQTVNVLMHAETLDGHLDELQVCGDRAGPCSNGSFGGYK